MDSVSPGYPCGSDTAHLFTYYNGRGAFEALGGGMPMDTGDIAFKSNFSTMFNDIVKHRRCDRHFEHERPILCQYLVASKFRSIQRLTLTLFTPQSIAVLCEFAPKG
jgi:2,3-bisphosphoglycerate-independent phosphoglycerate mutase